MTVLKLLFCPGCGQLLRSPAGEADCDNCGGPTDEPIEGSFDESHAQKLIDVG